MIKNYSVIYFKIEKMKKNFNVYSFYKNINNTLFSLLFIIIIIPKIYNYNYSGFDNIYDSTNLALRIYKASTAFFDF